MTGTSPQQETVLVLESLQKSLREVPPRKNCSTKNYRVGKNKLWYPIER